MLHGEHLGSSPTTRPLRGPTARRNCTCSAWILPLAVITSQVPSARAFKSSTRASGNFRASMGGLGVGTRALCLLDEIAVCRIQQTRTKYFSSRSGLRAFVDIISVEGRDTWPAHEPSSAISSRRAYQPKSGHRSGATRRPGRKLLKFVIKANGITLQLGHIALLLRMKAARCTARWNLKSGDRAQPAPRLSSGLGEVIEHEQPKHP